MKDHPADKVEVWEVNKNLSNGNQSIESLVPGMINDLAFQFVHEQCRKGDTSEHAYPKTWEAFKSLINARKEYSRYANTNNEIYLNRSIGLVASIRQQEPRFVGKNELKLLWDLSLALIEHNRQKDAEFLYKPLSRIEPLESNTSLGLIHGRMGDYEVALRFFNNSTQINPRSFNAWFYKGVTHENMKQHDAAIKSFKKAIDIDSKSKSESAWNSLGWNLHLMHNNSAAIDAFERSIKINISYARARYNKGLVHQEEHDYSLAMDELGLAIEYDSKFSQPWNAIGAIYHQKGEYKDALKAYDKAISLNPRYADPWNNKGLTFEKLNLHYEALEAYDRSILLSPDWTAPLINKGLYLNKIGLQREANESFKDALKVAKKSPRYSTSLYDIGFIYYQLKEYNKSLASCNEAIELDAKWAAPWNNKGNVLRDQGKMDEAIKAYERAIELDAKWAAPWNGKGNVLWDQGKMEGAIDAYERAIELDAKWATPWNGKGNVLRYQGKMDEAIKAYERAIELDAKLTAPWNGKGNVLRDQGKMDEAVEAYEKAKNLGKIS